MQKVPTQGLMNKFKDGDWVNGKSIHDEKFRGYIEAMNVLKGTVRVKVTECDNEASIGRSIECFTHSLEILPTDVLNEEGYLYNLIDVALNAKDQEWFMELTEQLIKVKQVRTPKTKSFGLKK